MTETEPRQVRIEVAESMVNHLATSGETLATPGDPVAKVRREVLRGLRAPK